MLPSTKMLQWRVPGHKCSSNSLLSWVPSQHTPDPPVFGQQGDIICKFPVFREISVRPYFEAIAFQVLLYADVPLMQNVMPWSVPAYPSDLFRILLLRRLRLPLPLFARTCRCRRTFDSLGDHRAACAQSGALRSRGGPLERAAARVCREAGARVTTHTRLADLNVQHVQHIDDRRIEVIANGLALWGGAQLAVDTTIVSPLTRAGEPRRRAGRFAGAALTDARKAKERAYPELLRNSRCRLVVFGIEVGGRCSEEAASFITSLARTKTRDTPAPLRHAAATSLISRWTALLTHAAMTAFAASLLFEDPTNHHNLDGEPPSLSDLLAQLPPDPTDPSRLPPR